MSDRRVVITGMGLVCPLGCSVDLFWQRYLAGESGVAPVERFDVSRFPVRFGGECREFKAAKHLDSRAVQRMDRFAQFGTYAALDAFDDSGLEKGAGDPFRFGVITGSGIGGLQELEDQHARLVEKGPTKVSAFTIPKLMVNAGSGNISIRVGACGPNTAVATACASATHAMGDALNAIRAGKADVMITGGAEAALTPIGLAAFSTMKALSQRNNDPTAASRPFDRDRDGFVLGEGAGMFVFEEAVRAKKRSARIYAEVLGFGMSADAYHITQPVVDGRGGARSMLLALADAKLAPDAVDYINAHGTSTPLGDVAETLAIKSIFGDHARRVSVSSTKSAIGHLLGASGGVELIATILAIRYGVCPPTLNLENPGEGCDLNYTPKTPRDQQINVALSNSFGFGGHNASIIIGKPD